MSGGRPAAMPDGFRYDAGHYYALERSRSRTSLGQTNPELTMKPLAPVRLLPRTLLAALLVLSATACVYRIDIQQGNFLENKEIDQVSVGMTRSQVRYLLGTPIVGNAFQDTRWDYVYYLKRGVRKAEQRHFTVYFEEDKVTRIDRPDQAVAQAANQASS